MKNYSVMTPKPPNESLRRTISNLTKVEIE
jgi:hypothetical protein